MSDLEDLYREIILDHYRSPRNRGELEVPPAHRAEGFNPLCGDEIVVYLVLDDPAKGERATITDVRIGGQGCSISQSSASMMSAAVKGKTVAEVHDLSRSFKAMMSIHEGELEGDGGAAEPTGEPGATLGDAGCGEVPGAHQVRHAVVEHPGPGSRGGLGRDGLIRRRTGRR
jgi:nitrogen fixation NifU-like protein